MGPEGFESIEDKLKEAGFDLRERQSRPADLKVYPEVVKKKDSVPFVEVGVRNSHSNASSLDILNALSSIVTMDALGQSGPAEDVSPAEPLLHPIDIGDKHVRFLDLHYPASR